MPTMKPPPSLFSLLLLAATLSVGVATPICPWSTYMPMLDGPCICDYNLANVLSIQCDSVDYSQLMRAVRRYASQTSIDQFFINNSTINGPLNGSLLNLKIAEMQLSSCGIRTIDSYSFRDQAETLRYLNLRRNELTEIPREALENMSNLIILDISANKIKVVENDTFSGLRLETLKLSDQPLVLRSRAFRGLESTLKNLNLRGTKQKTVPEAIRGLEVLAFLDLSLNHIQKLPDVAGIKTFEGLRSLTGLNLEGNVIGELGPDAFSGVKSSLSSLSLLNNILQVFPTSAINSLHHLQVLDIGFNLIAELPVNAFANTSYLTLLALDGNPLPTVPEGAFLRLNKTLRGLSLGGQFLVCDCKLRWILEWIRWTGLHVTSREKSIQYCGKPDRFQNISFHDLVPEQLTCKGDAEAVGIGTVESVDVKELSGPVNGVVEELLPTRPSTKEPKSTTIATTSLSISPSTTEVTPVVIDYRHSVYSSSPTFPPSTTTTTSTTTGRPVTRTGNVYMTRTTTSQPKFNAEPVHTIQQQPKHPLVLGSPAFKSKADREEIIVKDVIRQDNSVIIFWDTDAHNILGFRVIYRLFGDSSFKQAPPLEASEREFKIKNVPSQECMVVCVISLEDTNVTPANVPFNQCREIRTESSPTSNMDKITIAASAAICATIVVAVIIFLVANRRRARKLHTLHDIDQTKMGGPIASLPVNCCSTVGPTPSPGGPLPSMATLSAYNSQKEWDQVSAYSGRSIPRPRIFPVDRQGSMTRVSCIDDVRQTQQGHYTGKSTRSVIDGQSQHSFSNNSSRYFGNATLTSNLINTRPELRQSRQSLAATSERMSRGTFPAVNHLPPQATSRRQRPLSRNRTLEQNHVPRPGSRYSLAESTHTLNNYDENNYDHDMDIYMARNPTTRGGLVPL